MTGLFNKMFFGPQSECSVKNENDATLAFSVSSALIASLIAYKVKNIQNIDSASLVNKNSSIAITLK